MLPQGSSFGICKAELFGDKRAIWKIGGGETAGGFDRLVDTKSKEQARLPQHSSCMGDTLQPRTPRIPAVPSGEG